MTAPVGRLPLDAAIRMVERRLLTDTVRFYKPGGTDPDTFEPLPDVVVWEGPGAIMPDHSTDVTLRLADGQSTAVGTTGRYRLLTPLTAPIPTSEHSITLVRSKDPFAVGRIWKTEGTERSSHPVVRTTWLTYDTTANNGS
jgi:hypothetical protein